jgi:hypothetical protein
MRSQADTKARQIPKLTRPSANIAGSQTYKFIEPSPQLRLPAGERERGRPERRCGSPRLAPSAPQTAKVRLRAQREVASRIATENG